MKERIVKSVEKLVMDFASQERVQTEWKRPLVGFAAATDPLFGKLKDVVSPTHATPGDILPEARTVIAYFIPFSKSLSRSNIKGRVASEEWAVAYIETNELINELSDEIRALLLREGKKSALIPATHNFSEEKLMSDWSHRHIGYIAGVGTFGLNNMLITEKGCSGRIGSIVTTAEIEPDPLIARPNCLYKFDGSCRKCVDRCVNQALTEDWFNRFKCYEWLLENVKIYESLGYADVCGKCLVALPCSHANPVKKKIQATSREE